MALLDPLKNPTKDTASPYSLYPAGYVPPPAYDYAGATPGSAFQKSNPGGGITPPAPPAPSAPSASRIDGSPIPTPGAPDMAASFLSRYNADTAQTTDQLIAEREKGAQGVIDAINQRFDAMVTAQNKIGAENKGEATAMAAHSGLGGSPTGATMLSAEEQKNQDAINAINADRQTQISGVYSTVDQNAVAESQARASQANTDAKSYLDTLSGIADKAMKNITGAADFELLRTQDPQKYQQLLDQAGITDNTARGAWVAAHQSQIVGQPLVSQDGYSTTYFTQDPQTGQLTPHVIKSQVNLNPESKPIPLAGGNALAVQDPATGQWSIVPTGVSASTGKWQRVGTDENGNPVYGYPPSKSSGTPPKSGGTPSGGGAGSTPSTPSATTTLPTANSWEHNATTKVSATEPDQSYANDTSPVTGRTPNAVYQSALGVALKDDKVQSMVGGLASNTKTASGRQDVAFKRMITNIAGAMGALLGGLPKLQELYKIDAAAAAKLVGQGEFIKTYTATATDNMNLALAQSPNVGRSDQPYVNSVFQKYQNNFAANPDLTKFEVYIYTAAREYAKVTGGGAMSAAALTDSATAEAQKLLSAAQSPGQLQAAITAMQDDMANVNKEFYSTAISTINDSLSGLGGGGTASSTGSYDDYLKAIGQ